MRALLSTGAVTTCNLYFLCRESQARVHLNETSLCEELVVTGLRVRGVAFMAK